MTGPKKHTDYQRQGRKHRLIRELVHDPYMARRKLPEPTACPECGAVFHHGRWEWGDVPAMAHEEMCPACHRLHDRVPAGFLRLSGDFFAVHREEITHLIRNVEKRERAEHPLKRIMNIEEQKDGLLITFTDPHLSRGVGEAIHHAYEGELNFEYSDEEYMLRVYWKR